MPGIGWKCQCGEIIEEGKNFKWEFKCCCGGGVSHSEECEGKDWQAKKTALDAMIEKHAVVCKQISRCDGCSKYFGYDGWLKVNSGEKEGKKYHKSCWEKIEEEGNQPTCPKCGKRFDGFAGFWCCDKCYEEEEQQANQQKCERCLTNKSEIRLTIKKGVSEEEKLVCQKCYDKYQKENNSNNNRERERETKIYCQEANALTVVYEPIPKESATLNHV